jgi:hypothetical protein
MANVNIFFEKYKKEILIGLGVALISWAIWQIFFRSEKPTIAFYHWKTTLDLTDDEEKLLLKNKTNPLYIRLMDLVWDEDKQFAIPTAQLQVRRPIPTDIAIAPVLFITNEVFEKTPSEQIENIAERVIDRIHDKLYNNDGESPLIKELQVDCDWTVTTKDKYFAFLKHLNTGFSFPITATIRLHQVKFFEKTGVPPVKRGMLMFYNMGDLGEAKTQNSILDLETAKSYMTNFDKYPLSLDVALPLFEWGVVRRDGKVVNLLNALTLNDLSDSLTFKKLDKGLYRVEESSYLKSYYCYEGDEIRLESASPEQLKEAAKLLAKYLKKEQRKICFYHLDSDILLRFPPEILDDLVKIF